MYYTILCGAFALIWYGCGGEQEMLRSSDSAASFIARYEQGFSPSVYNPSIDQILSEEKQRLASLTTAAVFTTTAPETALGFRVQVLLTQEIDQATAVYDSLTSLFPDQLAYLVFDPPSYKVRVGNFLDRPTASALLQQVLKLGYKDAWVVPDNILKNPPPKLPENFIVPERTTDQHR